MKKAIALVALLSFAVAANASVQIYFTNAADGYGLPEGTDPLSPSSAITSDDQVPDYSNNQDVMFDGTGPYDMLDPTMFADYTAPTETCPEIAAPGDIIYIWGKFIGEAKGAKLLAINGGIAEADPATCEPIVGQDGQPVYPDLGGQTAYYRFDASWAGSSTLKRWDGASTEADNYATFRNNPQRLTAVTAYGIQTSPLFGSMNPFGQAAAVGGPEVFLLGAVAADALDPAKCYTYAVTTDTFGDPEFVIGSTPQTPLSDCFSVTPEPASLLLVGLAGLLIRRR